MYAGKRDRLARILCRLGVPFLLDRVPSRDILVVLNYHRIGNPSDDEFDPGVFSATAGEFDEQISLLDQNGALVSLPSALAFIEGRELERQPRYRVLITFDDGYLDNYETAFPILRAHGVPAVFFLCTGMVGSSRLPWWDHIAYLMRNARRRRYSLAVPAPLAVDVDRDGLSRSLRNVIQHFKRPDNIDPDGFLAALAEGCGAPDLPETRRRFLDWNEAFAMLQAGMAIGSHTCSHRILGALLPEQQRWELTKSRVVLQERLGVAPDALAYPVGEPSSFSELTQQLAREAGYRAAFSFHGGVNRRETVNCWDVWRIAVGGQCAERFRLQNAVCRVAARYWP